MSDIRQDKLSGMMGLAMRAGKVIIGTEQVCIALGKSIKPRLVVLSDGASDGTKAKVGHKCEYYGVELITVSIDTGELGRILGKSYAPACIAITDEGLAKRIKELGAAVAN